MLRTRVLILVLLAIAATATDLAADSIILNGGFEQTIPGTTKPTDWTVTNNVNAWSNPTLFGLTISPHSGNLMAVMANGAQGDAQVSQQVDFTGSSRATLSWWWRYEASDFDVIDNGRDAFEVWIGMGSSPTSWNMLWSAPIDVDPGQGWVVSPWQFATISGDTSGLGLVTFRFKLRNAGCDWDGGVQYCGEPAPQDFTRGQGTVGFLDDVTLRTSVPEPASLLLLGAGLVGLGVVRRRR